MVAPRSTSRVASAPRSSALGRDGWGSTQSESSASCGSTVGPLRPLPAPRSAFRAPADWVAAALAGRLDAYLETGTPGPTVVVPRWGGFPLAPTPKAARRSSGTTGRPSHLPPPNVKEHPIVAPEDPPRRDSDDLARRIVILVRSAEAHDRAALMMDEDGKPDRARWHRAAAARTRDQARQLEAALEAQDRESD